MTNFTKDEQITMMTLWSIFRSPMMIGGELTKLDDWTLELLTNKSVLRLLTHSHKAKQVERDAHGAVWYAKDTETDTCYVALFNFNEATREMVLEPAYVGKETLEGLQIRELWTGEQIAVTTVAVASHGAKLFEIK